MSVTLFILFILSCLYMFVVGGIGGLLYFLDRKERRLRNAIAKALKHKQERYNKNVLRSLFFHAIFCIWYLFDYIKILE